MESENAGADGLPFERPLTAREKAAALERSKRDAEMAEIRKRRSENAVGMPQFMKDASSSDKRSAEMEELRKLRSEKGGGLPQFWSQQSASSEAARKKREQEMEEIRKLKAGENEENRKRLSTVTGSGLTTDMDAWRSNQSGAKDADRKNKLEAQRNLHGHRSQHESKATEAQMDKAAQSQALRDRVSQMNMKGMSLDADGNPYKHEEGGVLVGGEWVAEAEDASLIKPGTNVMFKDGPNQHIPMPEDVVKPNGKSKVSFDTPTPPPVTEGSGKVNLRGSMEKQGSKVNFADAPDEQIPVHVEDKGPRVSFSSKAVPILSPEEIAAEEAPKVKFEETSAEVVPEVEDKPAAGPEPEEAAPPLEENEALPPPPAYSRVDIKFSFGLIVRSSAADGFETENLRDNETLRKCMEGTSKILHVQLPSPPKVGTETDYSKYPDAYYDPSLEPTVISIEEDQREGSDAKKTAKGNKRTLVKASFPVFLRDEAADDEVGRKKGARMLKETKTTVFKALRAAVSGGSFLR